MWTLLSPAHTQETALLVSTWWMKKWRMELKMPTDTSFKFSWAKPTTLAMCIPVVLGTCKTAFPSHYLHLSSGNVTQRLASLLRELRQKTQGPWFLMSISGILEGLWSCPQGPSAPKTRCSKSQGGWSMQDWGRGTHNIFWNLWDL